MHNRRYADVVRVMLQLAQDFELEPEHFDFLLHLRGEYFTRCGRVIVQLTDGSWEFASDIKRKTLADVLRLNRLGPIFAGLPDHAALVALAQRVALAFRGQTIDLSLDELLAQLNSPALILN